MDKEPKLILTTIKNMVAKMTLSKKREESNLIILSEYIRDLEKPMDKTKVREY